MSRQSVPESAEGSHSDLADAERAAEKTLTGEQAQSDQSAERVTEESAVSQGTGGSSVVPMAARPLVRDKDDVTVVTSSSRDNGGEEKRPAAPLVITESGHELHRRLFNDDEQDLSQLDICLGEFRVLDRIGTGGMGAVFRARDTELSREVALKVLYPASAADPATRQRFRNEARACAELNHDNIARVFTAGSEQGIFYIAYEFARGMTLKEVVSEVGTLDECDVINFAVQICLALNHIHAAGIVHRDIKPSNIVLCEDGRVKVVDLGLARRESDDSLGDLTMPGTTLGTFDYISPEQARDPRRVDIRSDIYSLGCTMYHLLTGAPPFPEGTALQKLLDHQGKKAPDPRERNPAVSVEMAGILRRMIHSDPDMRFQVPAELLQSLLALAGRMGLRTVPAEGIAWRRTDTVSRRQPLGAIWIFAAVALLAATALLIEFAPRDTAMNPMELELNESPGTMVGTGPEEQTEPLSPRPDSNGDTGPTTPPVVGDEAPALWDRAIVLGVRGQAGMLFLSDDDWKAAATPAVMTAEELPFAVVSGASARPKEFRTFAGAIAGAEDGDVILLRYNGLPSDLMAQGTARIVSKNLTIRPDTGYRPILEFDAGALGVMEVPRMISLRDQSELTLRDLDLRLTGFPDSGSDPAVLFDFDGPNRLTMENVSIDVRGVSDGDEAAVLRLRDATASGPRSDYPEVDIQLSDVAVRGRADLVLVTAQAVGTVSLQNAVVGLDGSLIRNAGSASMLSPPGDLRIRLRNSTFLLTHPAIDSGMTTDLTTLITPGDNVPSLYMTSEACVYAGTDLTTPFVRTLESVTQSVNDVPLTWEGFTNLYFGYEYWWTAGTPGAESLERRLRYTDWVDYWEQTANGGETNTARLVETDFEDADWQTTGDDVWSTLQPNQLRLKSSRFSAESPDALPLSRDALIPGADTARLPGFPED